MEIFKKLLPWTTLIILIICLTYLMTKIRFDYFGDDNKAKIIAFLKVKISLYIVAGLTIVTAVRYFEFMSQDLFIALLVGSLSALGVNLNTSTKSLKKMKLLADIDCFEYMFGDCPDCCETKRERVDG
jgi:energy-converting hydrogenase Eha subunit H